MKCVVICALNVYEKIAYIIFPVVFSENIKYICLVIGSRPLCPKTFFVSTFQPLSALYIIRTDFPIREDLKVITYRIWWFYGYRHMQYAIPQCVWENIREGALLATSGQFMNTAIPDSWIINDWISHMLLQKHVAWFMRLHERDWNNLITFLYESFTNDLCLLF